MTYALAGKHLERQEKLDANQMINPAFDAACGLPARLSWRSLLESQIESYQVPSPTDSHPQLRIYLLKSAKCLHVKQVDLQKSSKTRLSMQNG